MEARVGKVRGVNGSVVRAEHMRGFTMREMVMVGERKLIGEIIIIEDDTATIQVYEESSGLKAGEKIVSTGRPLSVRLGPGILGNIFDGIERPLSKLNELSPGFIPEGVGMVSLDEEKEWRVEMKVKEGDSLKSGDIYAEIQETDLIRHFLMVPPGISGTVSDAKENGQYRIEDTVAVVESGSEKHNLKLYQEWPVRTPRPTDSRMMISLPLVTGQRVLDSFFPIAKGGAVAIPGGFGTGKTITQHQLAKWSDADIIIYIGCGERGNEMTEVLEEFPKLEDPKTGKSLMNRTILIANTSNMPVSAREASIYTGITIAEYYRDMGYHVALMADSTSRWAEALREISGRLEEMPAEEGYPAYLPSRIAEFYERAGYFKNINGRESSITVIGSVSPPGGDFSEPVTENTKRFVTAFLSLDRELAYARHYPAINWLKSYSGYSTMLKGWYEENVADDMISVRDKLFGVLSEEDELKDIVSLVGEDVLPDNQRLVLEVAKVIKTGFLQQNAYHPEDAYVPLQKQYRMLKAIEKLYNMAKESIEGGASISEVRNGDIFEKLYKMKYEVPNDDLTGIDRLEAEIEDYYGGLNKEKSQGGEQM